MTRPARTPRRPVGAAVRRRHETVDRGLSALFRVDLHAMVRLLNGQRLTVADILGHRGDGSHRHPER